MQTARTGLMGAGVFGSCHAGKISECDHADFVGIYDPDAGRCAALAASHGVTAFACADSLLEECDAVVVACPASLHEEVVRTALNAGCHVMVEKPLALTAAAADELVALAEGKNLVLQVGHQERFVMDSLGLFDIGTRPIRIEAIRAGPPTGGGRAGDVSVIWDLMTHDLDMVGHLMGEPVHVEATGRRAHTEHTDEATVYLNFANGSAEITASRCASSRTRRMVLSYPDGQIEIDFLARSVKNTTMFKTDSDVINGISDPLAVANEAFFAACLSRRECAIPGRDAARAVRMAEQAEHSIMNAINV